MKTDFSDVDSLKNNAIVRIVRGCNQNCLFCNIYDKDNEFFFETPKEVLLRIRELIKKQDISSIILSGGEPTINKDLDKIISIIRMEGIREIHLQTNAMMFSYDSFIKRGIHKKIDFFLIPLHTHKKQLFDSLTRTPGSFDKTLIGIKNLVNEGSLVAINIIIMKQNYEDLPDICRLIEREFKEVFVSLSFVQPVGRAKDKNYIIPKMSDVAPYLREAISFLDSKKIRFSFAEGSIPVCFFPEFREKHAEFVRLSSKKADYLSRINRLNKVKSQNCKNCMFDDNCYGIWLDYADIYGTSELNPVKKQGKKDA